VTPVPLLDLRAQYATIRDEVRTALDAVLESQRFILGPEVESLEREIATYCQTRYAVGVSSGTDALLIALMAIDLRQGDEVITTPYSFFATAGSIARLGGTPVFVDIDRATFNIQADAIEARITSRTKAIIPVHLFGLMADMDTISRIARRHNLAVIEDAAQAIGSDRNGKRAGSAGQMGCFSFYPSKNLGGFGDGGIVTPNDSALYERLRQLRNHGISQAAYHSGIVGGNFRLDAIQAAVLRVKLKYLDRWTEARRRNATAYRESLNGCQTIELPDDIAGTRHVYNQFVIRTERRDQVIAFLKERGIGNEVYYPVPLHLQECFKNLGYKAGDLPVSEEASRRSLALPIYPELTPEMIQTVANAIRLEGVQAR
jgi:dTDP-4-amino-4,6-dideoxygalactose transaminase